MVEHIYQEVERLEKTTISFDIFDTLIIREHFWPKVIFSQVGKEIGNQDYTNHRINAENNARRRHANLEDIKFQYLADEIPQETLQKELDIELASCIANPEMFELYTRAIQLGYRVIATSDMYLDEATLRKILDNAGYTQISKIYVSSEHAKTKGSGNLFKHVLATENIESKNLMHIGDNLAADVNMPSSLGILSFHYVPVEQQLQQSNKVNKKLISVLKDSGVSGGLLAYALWRKLVKSSEDKSYWYRFGYTYTGPILMGFCNYLAKEAINNSLQKLYFMSRDGELMLAGFRKMFPDIEAEYLYASRRMYHFSSITELDEPTLQYLSAGIAQTTTVKEYFERLCIISEEAKTKFFSHFDNIQKTINTKKDRQKLYEAFTSIADFILPSANTEKTALLAYLDKIGLTADSPVGVIDSGWAASSQKFLEKITNKKLHGYYLGTHGDAYRGAHVKGFLFENGQPRNICENFFQCIEIIELLFVGKHASVAKMELQDNQPIPVFLEASDDERKRISIANEIHQGALDFIDEALSLFQKWQVSPDAELINNLIYTLLMEPELEDIEQIGSVPHNASIGNSSFTPIIDWDITRKDHKASNITYLKVLYNILAHKKTPHIYWQAGLDRYYYLTRKRPLLAVPVKNYIAYLNNQRRPEKPIRNLFKYIKQSFSTSCRKKVLSVSGTSNEWIMCSGGSKIKWFESQQSSDIDFDSSLGVFIFRKHGVYNISGCIHVAKDVTSKIYLYHLKRSLKIKSTFLVIHHNGEKAQEASIHFNVTVEARKRESFFLSTALESTGIQAGVLCSPTHSYISSYRIK